MLSIVLAIIIRTSLTILPKSSVNPIHIGILCAMPEELGSTLKNLKNISETIYGDLKIFSGEWDCDEFEGFSFFISLAWSGWGKVCAARAATRLIGNTYKNSQINFLLFTGVAGAGDSKLKQWDIVIPSELIQHDMDARPLFPKYVIPILKRAKIDAQDSLVNWATQTLKNPISDNFGKIENGLIATADKFIADKTLLNEIKKDLPDLKAVEMEGAAVAQIACQENIPWLIVRVISDSADNSAAQNFSEFLKEYEKNSWKLIRLLLLNFKNCPISSSH